MEPGDGDDVRVALELLEWRRSSSNGSGLRAAPELLERRRLAGSTGVLRTGAEFAAGGEAFGMRSVSSR